MKILSLFDGMACGMIAMKMAGVDVESYDAYEIDKYAVKTAQHNFPLIQEHGDVFVADFTQYAGVDFLIGGSPCTHWSIAQTKNRETTVSRDEKGQILLHSSGIGFELFSQYLRALEEATPTYFIYENNKSMSKNIRAAITELFGFEPVCINSALVSAQNRQRLYWVGIRNADGTYSKANVEQPEDRGILLKDVLDSAFAWREKPYTLDVFDSSTVKAAVEDVVAKKGYIPEMRNPYHRAEITDKSPTLSTGSMVTSSCATILAEPVGIKHIGSLPMPNGELSTSAGFRIYSTEAKGRYVCANGGGAGAKTGLYAIPYAIEFDENGKPIKDIGKDGKQITVYEVSNGQITIKGKQYPIKLLEGYYIIRKLTVSECKRLQTVPEWYDFSCVSNSQAYKMLGNGWTCEVITLLIKACLSNQEPG